MQVPYLVIAASASITILANSLVLIEDCKVFYLVSAMTAVICAIIAYQRAIFGLLAVRVWVKRRAAGVAAEAANMPAVSP